MSGAEEPKDPGCLVVLGACVLLAGLLYAYFVVVRIAG